MAEASIAVLPFDNLSGDAGNDPFTDGLHDDLLTQLSKIRSLKVISRTSVQVRYELKTPYRDGTTHVIFEPVDFAAPAHPCARGISVSLHVIAKLAALVPRPSVNLTRLDEGHPCPSPCRQPSVVQIHSR